MRKKSWLLFLYGLPTASKTARVNLWRKLKKFGALQHISSYLLPDESTHRERFQWLTKQVQDEGGEASVIATTRVGELSDEEIVRLFQAERGAEYRILIKELQAVVRGKRRRPAEMSASLDKAQRRFREIKSIDYFAAPEAHEAEILLGRLQNPQLKRDETVLDKGAFLGKTWLTRPRPEIDRVGSAWLIKRFIDPEANFVFGARTQEFPHAIPYDMPGVEFTHHGSDCTFETLLKRFDLRDATLVAMGEMIHDADLEDGKFGRNECVGLELILKGFGASGLPDDEILKRGFICFDGLMTGLR